MGQVGSLILRVQGNRDTGSKEKVFSQIEKEKVEINSQRNKILSFKMYEKRKKKLIFSRDSLIMKKESVKKFNSRNSQLTKFYYEGDTTT